MQVSFKGHLNYAGEKTAKANTRLAGMTPNIGGSKFYHILTIVPIGAEALDNVVNQRVCSADEALRVIIEMIPLDLLVN